MKANAHITRCADNQLKYHDLQSHLVGTANRASQFASAFGNADWAFWAGLFHDLGKYSTEFQHHLLSYYEEATELHVEGGHALGRVDHSTAGAIYATEKFPHFGKVLAYLIAGHHAGLPDWDPEPGAGGALSTRLLKTEQLHKAACHDLPEPCLPNTRPCGAALKDEHFHMWIRMLFSCLVDADFLDTEAFMNPEKAQQRSGYCSLQELKARFSAHMTELMKASEQTPVNRLRAQILQDCLSGAELQPGFFSLTVPTGGGQNAGLDGICPQACALLRQSACYIRHSVY